MCHIIINIQKLSVPYVKYCCFKTSFQIQQNYFTYSIFTKFYFLLLWSFEKTDYVRMQGQLPANSIWTLLCHSVIKLQHQNYFYRSIFCLNVRTFISWHIGNYIYIFNYNLRLENHSKKCASANTGQQLWVFLPAHWITMFCISKLQSNSVPTKNMSPLFYYYDWTWCVNTVL